MYNFIIVIFGLLVVGLIANIADIVRSGCGTLNDTISAIVSTSLIVWAAVLLFGANNG